MQNGILKQGAMLRTWADSAVPFPASSHVRANDRRSRCEDEVIRLFEQFHHPLLRYVISLGLTSHDGEEIIQEVFLALFHHLLQEKSQQNLRGWIFRVAHNLALKQRTANRRAQTLFDSDETLTVRQPDLSPNPEQHAVSNQRWQRM